MLYYFKPISGPYLHNSLTLYYLSIPNTERKKRQYLVEKGYGKWYDGLIEYQSFTFNDDDCTLSLKRVNNEYF